MNSVIFKKKIDGFVILGQNFRFFSPAKNLTMKIPFIIRSYNTAHFLKGFHSIQSSKVFCSHLGEVQDTSVSILFSCLDNILDYKKLCSLMKCTLIETIENHQESETYHCYMQTAHEENHTSEINIYLGDFEFLLTEWINRLRTGCLEDNAKIFVYASATGQSYSAKHLMQQFPSFNWIHVVEFVLHCAFDFSEAKHMLMCRRDALINLFGIQPAYEYYPLAIPNIGNFYFQTMVSAAPVSIEYIKFYSQYAKYFHRSPNPPFRTSSTANFIFEVLSSVLISNQTTERQRKSRCGKLIHDAAMIFKFLEINPQNLYARCEVLVTSFQPLTNPVSRCFSTAENFIKSQNIQNCEAIVFWIRFQ